jgi:hypothetical protein
MKKAMLVLSVVLLVLAVTSNQPFAQVKTDKTAKKASIQVFDANGQYLGLFAGGTAPTTFIPELDLFTEFGADGKLIQLPVVFTERDCGGQNYFVRMGNTPYLASTASGYKYYQQVAPVKATVYSQLTPWDGVCSNFGSPYQTNIVPAHPISGEEIPFTLPVSLPFIFIAE